ncbi:alpha/beta hydrolase [Actinopolymorpha sp. B9G3]|uniref:alpha/beta fold hydrolase n=1 Tax=Actinopolymorpha sp. B9G3 TaxID=3158970 RepID=UPI0032D9A6B2
MAWTRARDGLPLYYECFEPASRPRAAVLLLMGLGANARIWAPVVAPLRAAGHTVVAMDNRGCGRSGVPWRPWSTRTMAADAVAVLDALGVRRTHVIGASMGGMVAQELALAFPERVHSLVLGCTSGGLPRGPALVTRRGVREVLALAVRTVKPVPLDVQVERFLCANISGDFAATAPRDGECWRAVEAMLAEPTCLRGLLHQSLATVRHSSWSRVGGLRPRVLVQHGTADPVIPVAAGRELARRIPSADFQQLDGAGHALGLERTEEITQRALAFMRAEESGSRV